MNNSVVKTFFLKCVHFFDLSQGWVNYGPAARRATAPTQIVYISSLW